MASTSYSQNISTSTEMMWPNNLLSTYDYVHIDVEEFSSVRSRRVGRSSAQLHLALVEDLHWETILRLP